MKVKCCLVFDIGKTNQKYFLFDKNYKILKRDKITIPKIKDEDGHIAENIQGIVEWMRLRFNDLLQSKRFEIEKVNFSAFGATLVNLDQNGEVVTPVYDYHKSIKEDILVSFNVSNNTGENLEDLNIQINSSDIYLSSENIITISEINSGETILVEGLILNIPPAILPDSEPLFFVNISDNNSSLESNQFLDLEIYSGTVSLHAQGNFFPGIITDFNIELYNSGEINFSFDKDGKTITGFKFISKEI